jgi:integrase
MSRQEHAVYDLAGNFWKTAEADRDDDGKSKDTFFFDDRTKGGLAGLYLRILPSGLRSWGVMFKLAGKRRYKSLGGCDEFTCGQARKLAKDKLFEAAQGIDPDAKNQTSITWGQLAERYLAEYAKVEKRSWATDERRINGDLSGWKKLPASGITRADIRAILAPIIARDCRSEAARCLSLISMIFRWGNDTGLIDIVSPAIQFKSPEKKNPRSRILEEHEIRKLWSALTNKPSKVAAFVKLCLLTGARAREVLQIEVKELDLDAATWLLPAARSKNKREHLVPLTESAIAAIESIKNGSKYLFPTQDKTKPMITFRVWIDELRDELKFDPDWTCHDLRRTAASLMTRNKVSRFDMDRVLNHTDTGVGAVYDRYEYLDEKRNALKVLEAALLKIAEGASSSAAKAA